MSGIKSTAHWLRELELKQYIDVFEANDIDTRALPHLTDGDLKELGVSLGHRRILLAAAAQLSDSSPSPDHFEPTVQRQAERRPLSIMFCDLVGSTALSRQMDPEDLHYVMGKYQNSVTQAVVRYSGYVAKFQGDGIVVYFGWPQDYEDQAERAVRAGLDAITAVRKIEYRPGQGLSARIGIATGQVVIGDLVGEVTTDMEAVIGETPNLAARLQSVASPDQIVIGLQTRQLLGTTFELKDLGSHSLKGFSEAVFAWSVVGESSAESRFEAARGSVLSGLVGREPELALLQERWQSTKSGEGQAILLSGEAGIGKSRLTADFKSRIDSDSLYALSYQCSPHHTNSAFYPVIQRIQRAAGFVAGDAVETKLDKLEMLLRQMNEQVDQVAPLFAALLSLPAEQRYGPLRLTPQQLRHQTIQALINQVMILAQQRTVLFVVEDVHWIDPSMSEFISEFLPHIVARNIMILISYRPEFKPSWSGTHVSTITLNRLGRGQAAEIAHSVGGVELRDAIIDRIVVRADGVPLYIEELTKAVLESYLNVDDSAADDLIPPTLQSSLVARLDRLKEAREIAQIGSAIGREFSHRLLAAVFERSEQELHNALEKLVESGLVFRQGIEPDVTYTFKHSLVQDTAYSTILQSRRRRLHARIVDALESGNEAITSDRIDLMAHHAFQAEDWEIAFTYLEQSGSRAMDRAEVREAVAKFEQALTAGAHLPETRESLEKAVDLRFELRNGLWSIAEFEEILINLSEAERLAKKLDDPVRTGWISVFNSASHWQIGRQAEARASASNALEINENVNDISLAIGGNFYLGCTTVTGGDCREAENLFQVISDLTDGELLRERCGLPFVPSVVARSWLVWALAERGEFEAAQLHGDVALKIAREVGHPFNLAHIYYDLGYFYGVQGRFSEAVEALKSAHDYIVEWNLSYLSPFITGFYGHVTALSGQIEAGLLKLQRAVSEYESMGLGLFRSLVNVQLGEALLMSEYLEQAMDQAKHALALTRKRNERGHEAHALRLIGDIFLRSDPFEADQARSSYQEAINIATPLGMRPVVAHCTFGLARAARMDNHDAADVSKLFDSAADMYSSMNMAAWVNRVDAFRA